MINYVWSFMILASVVVGIITKSSSEVAQSVFDGANNAIKTVISFMGVTAMWCGIMKIAEESGLIRIFSRIIKPINLLLFPQLKKENKAMEAVSANMVANILGLSNAATPLGIKAMRELDNLNNGRKRASNSMCMFAIINSASIQLIPSTMIGIRASMNSEAPAEIIVPVWIVSLICATCGVLLAKLFEKR